MMHTSGPWKYKLMYGIHHCVVDADGNTIAFDVDSKPLALLLATAPELLRACRVALDALGCDRVRQERLDAQKIIHAAIKLYNA